MRQEFFHNENRHSRFINRVSRWPGVNRAFALMKVKDARGYSLLELLIVMGMISVIAAIAVPRLLRARISSNEASAIGSMRTISSAQAAFAASCGGGGYAITVADLALPPTGGGQAFIPVDLAAATSGGTKSGYTFTITGATGGSVLAAADTCNGSANASETEFFSIGDPSQVGSTGQRFFAGDQSGQIRQDFAQLADMTAGTPLR